MLSTSKQHSELRLKINRQCPGGSQSLIPLRCVGVWIQCSPASSHVTAPLPFSFPVRLLWSVSFFFFCCFSPISLLYHVLYLVNYLSVSNCQHPSPPHALCSAAWLSSTEASIRQTLIDDFYSPCCCFAIPASQGHTAALSLQTNIGHIETHVGSSHQVYPPLLLRHASKGMEIETDRQ